jgi:trk system potassium uptake protein TrkH
MESISADQVGGIVKMTSFIFRLAFTVELIGAILILPSFCISFGLSEIWMAVFHSVSAFSNAAFDVMGTRT